jgi:hypothetical protein
MKFALLDPDDDALALTAALLRDGRNELTLFDSPDETVVAQLESFAPSADRITEWEAVLAGSNDFVLVGTAGPAQRRFEQLRRLLLENVAVIFVHPFGLQTLEYHELDMNRQATNTAIVPYAPLRHHTAASCITALSGAAALTELPTIGRLEQITIERQARVRSRPAALRHFVRDVGLVLRAVGPCNKVSALGKLGDAEHADAAAAMMPEGGHLGVQITTDDDVLIRWSIGTIVDGSGARVTLIGSEGNAVVTMPDDADWSLLIRRGDDSETLSFDHDDALPADALSDLVKAALTPTDDKLWREALADLELVEAVERSMRRARTVELFHEEASEKGTFHGVMSAVGCLLLMLAIGLAILASMLGWLKLRIANLWPYALLAILVVFLLMQLLKFVFPSEDRASRDDH